MTANRDKSRALASDGAARIWLPFVQAGLLRAQSRWRLSAMLHGAVWSMILGLAVFCALGATTLLLEGEAAQWLPRLLVAHSLLDQIATSAIAFVCALVVAVLATFLLTPDLAALARAADHRFALKERLTTALEVATARPSDAAQNPVRAALLADAEQSASSIDMRALVSLRLPRAVWGVPALLLTALLLLTVPPDTFGRATPGASATRNASDNGALSGDQAADTAANLRRIAEVLDQDGAQRSDPYLRTIARALERLSAEVGRAAIDRPQLARELGQLLAHAQRAYAQSGGPADQSAPPQHPTDLLRSALDEITGGRHADAAPARDPAAPKATAADRNPPGRPSQPQDRKASGTPTPAEQIAAAVRRLTGEDIPWLFVDEDGAEVDPRSQLERLMAEEERRARSAARSAGAAANAGRGEGDQAGDGVQPLGRGADAKATDPAATEQMLLPDPQGREGGRIRIEIPPNAVLSDVAEATSIASGGWRRMQEQSVERPTLEAEGRRIVGRYFKRSAGGRNDPSTQGPSP
jgi:hypothetical protein